MENEKQGLTIVEALASGDKISRKCWKRGAYLLVDKNSEYVYDEIEARYRIRVSDLLAKDWEVYDPKDYKEMWEGLKQYLQHKILTNSSYDIAQYNNLRGIEDTMEKIEKEASLC